MSLQCNSGTVKVGSIVTVMGDDADVYTEYTVVELIGLQARLEGVEGVVRISRLVLVSN